MVICRDLIITLVQCFCTFYFSPKAVSQKNGETQIIFIQRPDASYVKGYKAWNQLGRYVKKGSKGIKILCHCIRKVEVIKEPDETNVYNDKEAEKEIKKVISGFRVGYVYDLSDTDGDDNLIWISLNVRLLHRKVCYLLS